MPKNRDLNSKQKNRDSHFFQNHAALLCIQFWDILPPLWAREQTYQNKSDSCSNKVHDSCFIFFFLQEKQALQEDEAKKKLNPQSGGLIKCPSYKYRQSIHLLNITQHKNHYNNNSTTVL